MAGMQKYSLVDSFPAHPKKCEKREALDVELRAPPVTALGVVLLSKNNM